MLKLGDKAPVFELEDDGGNPFRLEDQTGRKTLLVLYPGDNTPVCTKQLCNYRDNIEVFADLGVQVFGINPQSLESHRQFADKHEFPFPLISDPKSGVGKRYGAAGLMGGAKRALVLIGDDGKVKWRKTDIPIFHQSADDIREAIADL